MQTRSAVGVAEQAADEEPVVEDVVVRECRALGEAGGPRRVLDVDRVAEAQRRGARCQRRVIDVRGGDGGPTVASEQHHVLEPRTDRAPGDHGGIVACLERRRRDQQADTGLVQQILRAVAPVRGVDVHEDGANLGRRVLDEDPLGAVRRPDTHAVALGDPELQERRRHSIDRLVELPVAPPATGRNVYERIVLRLASDRSSEVLADGPPDQRQVARSARVAALTHRDPLPCRGGDPCWSASGDHTSTFRSHASGLPFLTWGVVDQVLGECCQPADSRIRASVVSNVMRPPIPHACTRFAHARVASTRGWTRGFTISFGWQPWRWSRRSL